jgi:cytoskeletal protein CcmA (bactofilin family)
MFQKNNSNREGGHEPETVIAASVKVEGDFASEGNVLIEGVVEGSLKTNGDLRVGERARIAANVSASNATIAGEIRGNLTVGDRLELESTARVRGDVTTKILVVASGATIDGNVHMSSDSMEKAEAKASGRGLRAAAEKMRVTESEEKEPALVGEEKVKTVNPFFR